MHVILDTIEFARCEGRLINLDVFNPICTLESDLQFKIENRLSDWLGAVRRFAEYDELDGSQPIAVDRRSLDNMSHFTDHFGIDVRGCANT